jgi:two-component system sensor histidine kinase/response regulator
MEKKMPDLSGCKVLVVDDTEANIDILVETLGSDYDVSVAMDGETAIESVADEKPDLILLDIMMPDMDGYEVCMKLKSNHRTSNIPIIFVTAKDQVEDESKGFELGCVDYITKPVSPSIVLARVKTQLALKQALETLQSQNTELRAAAKLREDVERITRHDLKNPLTAIFVGVSLLESDASIDDDDAEESLSMINEAAHDMLKMINASLDLFKMEQDLYKPKLVNVDIINIIHRIKRDLRSYISLKQSNIEVVLKDRPIDTNTTFNVSGETLLLYSMLANLVKNALEATPDAEAISISLTEKKGQAMIHIHNTGSVPKELRKNIFQKYVTFGKKGGTGLGTYSAKLIAQTLGGNISMNSSETDGTTFSIILPKGI